jgi:uncharacterized membrane protein YbhN (UPF0104 family)
VGGFFHAVGTFFHHLAAVGWASLGIALLLQFVRLLARIPAWRNIIRAAYPESRVRWRSVYGAYIAGVGVNAVLPARSGDLLKLYLLKHRVEATTYPTLGATLIVETVFDTVVAGAILGWALSIGVLPSLHFQRHGLPQVDWTWPLRHPELAAVIAAAWLTVIVLLAIRGIRRARAFKTRVRQGFAILGDRTRFLREVASWQALSWVFRGLSIYFFLRAFHVHASAHNVLLVLSVQSISTLLPFTPGGVGTQQGFLVYVFHKTKERIPETTVLSFSIGMYIAVTLLSVVLGFAAIFVMLRTFRWRRVVAPEEEKAYARGP